MALINSFGALGSFAGSYIVGYIKWKHGWIWAFLYFYGRLSFPFSNFNNCGDKRKKTYVMKNNQASAIV